MTDDVQIKLVKTNGEEDLVTLDGFLTIVENNRGRIRNLGNLLLTVCGLLLSTTFVVLFFVLQEKTLNIPSSVPILLFGTIVSLMISTLYSILSSLVPAPVAIRTKLQLMDVLTQIYHRGYKRAVIAVISLFVAITLFLASLIIFAVISF